MDDCREPDLNGDPTREKRPYWSPYAAGFGLGITLLLSYWFLGTGLGASGAIARFAAWVWHQMVPDHVASSAYFGKWFARGVPQVIKYYLSFMAIGIFVGGLISAMGSGRVQPMVERGPHISASTRLWLALAGGVLAGFAARLARGCTSGQALTGTGMLFTGSVLFLVFMFIGAYVAAFFVRREWL
ncbi:MAG: YeeE/YedE family protein [Desulfobacteraceae bacterium]|nr:YeeE/YedE family protein [Desulfobacteraceae bacterium]